MIIRSSWPLRRAIYVSLALAAVAPVGASLAQESSSVLDEIIVTAQKREERLQDVPISVTALTGEQIANFKLNSGTDMARLTPNLRVSVAGNEDQPKFSIRGLSQFDFNLNASSPTGVFTDEVYVASQFLGGPQMYDMERVEVLRGPQGTLFGKNTTAGAVSFITRAPVLEGATHDHLSAEYGENNYYRLQGAANMTLIEGKLAARVAVNASQSDGWVKNRNANPEARDLSSINNHGLRIGLAYKKDDFDATLRFWSTRSSPTAIGIIAHGTCPNNCFPSFLTGGAPYPNNTNVARINPRVNPYTGQPFDVHEGAFNRSGEIEVKGDGANLALNFDLGDYKLTSISSYIDGSFLNLVDADGSIADLFALDFYADTRELSQDLRLASGFSGSFNFIAGLYYFEDTVKPVTVSRFGPPVSLPLLSIPSSTTSYTQARKSYAGYIDGTYAFTSKAELYAGLRVTKEKGDIDNFTTVLLSGVTTLPPISVGYDETEPSGRLGFRHRFSDDAMAYAQYARGYRSSAINGSAGCAAELNVAKPEFLDSFEVGFKSQWLDRHVTFNASAFYYKFKDQQFRNPAPGTVGCNSNNPLATQLVNAAKADLYGLELEASARVTDNFDLMAGLGLLDSEYKELSLYDSTAAITRDLSGNKLLEAPPYTFNLAADYRIPLANGSVVLHGDASFVGKGYFTAFNDIPPNAINVAKANWESNARIGYRSSDGHLGFGVWGKNLNNNEVVNWSVSPQVFGIQFTTVPYPRRFGIDVNFNFE